MSEYKQPEPMERVFVTVVMPDDSVWMVPAGIIADSYAAYFAGREVEPVDDESRAAWNAVYHDQYTDVIGNDDELLDWASNNMGWNEVTHAARRIKEAPALTREWFENGWTNGEKKVVRNGAGRRC